MLTVMVSIMIKYAQNVKTPNKACSNLMTNFMNNFYSIDVSVCRGLNISTLVQCPILMNPANGMVELSEKSPGDTATYSCVSVDYDLVGVSVRVCRHDGQWSGEAPICICK